MQTAQIVWLVLIALFLVVEGATVVLVSIWFCAGALVALVVSFFLPGNIAAQVLAFVLASALFLVALRPLAKRLVPGRRQATNADAAIGKLAQVVTEVRPEKVGRARLDNLEWSARADVVLPVGAWGVVTAIEGVKLVLVPAGPPPATEPDNQTEVSS